MLRQVFSLKIILYRIIQIIAYFGQELDTPKRVYELCQWLGDSR